MRKRTDSSAIGFGADLKSKQELDTTEWMHDVIPQDLVKYGLIPELVGRIPVLASLSGLDKDSLIRILVEPKNSLIKQYKKLFSFDNVELDFTEKALSAIAQKAIDRHTGARGLRAIMEELLTDIMFDVPSDHTIKRVCITTDTVLKGKDPEIEHDKSRKPVKIVIGSSTNADKNKRKNFVS